jgi:glycosyltransferase involved in cell wall biosynthesis
MDYNLENPRIDVLIPALNEAAALPLVIGALPREMVRHIVVCDNGSTDNTASVASEMGAIVVREPVRGYGNACLAGMCYLQGLPESQQPDILVFLDADYSDYPGELPQVVAPILNNGMDLVIGSRMLGQMPPDAMTPVQRFGNWLAPMLIRHFYGTHFTDLGPFRAIRWKRLLDLGMQDRNYGWTVEMQIKAARQKLACTEVPVRYRHRAAGKSKVSGTMKGSLLAGTKIIGYIFKIY